MKKRIAAITLSATVLVALGAAPALGATSRNPEAPPPLTVNPTSVAAGAEFTVSSAGCAADAAIIDDATEEGVSELHAYVLVTVGDAFVSVDPDEKGGWIASITAPAVPGTYEVNASCDDANEWVWSYDPMILTVTESSDPTDPSDSTAPTPPAEDSLVSANAGSVTIVGIDGATVVLGSMGAAPGSTVYGTIYSTPHPLGAAVVRADGTVSFSLPAGLEPGVHKIVLQDASGRLLGWVGIHLTGSGVWKHLVRTGGEPVAATTIVVALGLLAAGGLALVARRRHTATTRGE